MANERNIGEFSTVVYFVNHSIVSYADAPKLALPSEFLAATGSRVIRHRFNPCQYAFRYRPREPLQLASCIGFSLARQPASKACS